MITGGILLWMLGGQFIGGEVGKYTSGIGFGVFIGGTIVLGSAEKKDKTPSPTSSPTS